MIQVLREEKKFLLRTEERYRLSAKLRAVLHTDAHNSNQGYLVRSLYFDTVYDKDYFEKLDGLENRKKVRLRIYDPAADFAKLEVKQKTGNMQQKRSLTISRDDAAMLIRGNCSCLLRYTDPFAAECYSIMCCECYRPVTIVQYNRMAFVLKENNTRVTFDFNISATEANMNLFDPHLLLSPVMEPDEAVLEVKYNGILLNYVQDLLNNANKSEISVSKYVLARHNAYLT